MQYTLEEIRDYINAYLKKNKSGDTFTPKEYNDILPICQQELFNNYYPAYEQDNRMSEFFNRYKISEELIRNGQGEFTLPEDYQYFSSLAKWGVKKDINGYAPLTVEVVEYVLEKGENKIPFSGGDIIGVSVINNETDFQVNTTYKIIPDSYSFLLSNSGDDFSAKIVIFKKLKDTDNDKLVAFERKNTPIVNGLNVIPFTGKNILFADIFVDGENQNASIKIEEDTITFFWGGSPVTGDIEIIYYSDTLFLQESAGVLAYRTNTIRTLSGQNTFKSYKDSKMLFIEDEEFSTSVNYVKNSDELVLSYSNKIISSITEVQSFDDWQIQIEIEMLSEAFFLSRNTRGLRPTSIKHPIATIKEDKIEVLPKEAQSISLGYLRKMITPYYDFVNDEFGKEIALSVGDKVIQNVGNDYNIEDDQSQVKYSNIALNLPSQNRVGTNYDSKTEELDINPSNRIEVISIILQKLGVALAKQEVIQIEAMKEQQDIQK